MQLDVHANCKTNLFGKRKLFNKVNFIAGGNSFFTQIPNASNTAFAFGFGLKLYSRNGWDFSANYDCSLKQSYYGHSGYLRAAYQF